MNHEISGIFYRCRLSDRERAEFLIEVLKLDSLPKCLHKIADGTAIQIKINNSPLYIRGLEAGVQLYQDNGYQDLELMRSLHQRASTYFEKAKLPYSHFCQNNLKEIFKK